MEANKGLYDKVPLTKYLIFNFNLSKIAFSLPSEARFFKSWRQFNCHGNQRFRKGLNPGGQNTIEMIKRPEFQSQGGQN